MELTNTDVGFFQLLVPLVSSYRYCGDDVNLHLAKSEAKILHEKVAAKEYSCEDVIRILTTRSKAQINATLNQYKNDVGNDINKVIQASIETLLSYARLSSHTYRCVLCVCS